MDQIRLDPQDKLPHPPPPLGHVVNKTPSPPDKKVSAAHPPPEDNFWNSPYACLWNENLVQHQPLFSNTYTAIWFTHIYMVFHMLWHTCGSIAMGGTMVLWFLWDSPFPVSHSTSVPFISQEVLTSNLTFCCLSRQLKNMTVLFWLWLTAVSGYLLHSTKEHRSQESKSRHASI